jgi:hypothetical protein
VDDEVHLWWVIHTCRGIMAFRAQSELCHSVCRTLCSWKQVLLRDIYQSM